MDRSKNKNGTVSTDYDFSDQELNWNSLNLDAYSQGSFRQSLRNSIVASLKEELPQQNIAATKAASVVDSVLRSSVCNVDDLKQSFEELHEAFMDVYEKAEIARQLRRRRYICATGLVISPDHCTDTIKDIRRIYAFIKGIDQAIRDQWDKSQNTIQIVYPACGPFAPLLLPLISFYQQHDLFSPEQIRITLIDMQEGAIQGLNALIKNLGITSYIENVVCGNAMEYQAPNQVDIVVLEALQHGFSREGHLCLAKHFADMLNDGGVFLPEQISISAALNVGQREYIDQWNPDSNQNEALEIQQKIRSERTQLGEILKVNLPMLKAMKITQQDEHSALYECGEVEIPDLPENAEKQVLLIQTDISVFGQWGIGEYDSGITHPLPDLKVCINFNPRTPEPDDLLVKSGDSLKFYYCMNGLPGFLPIRIESFKHPQKSLENANIEAEEYA